MNVQEMSDYALALLPEDGSEVEYEAIHERAVTEGRKDALALLYNMKHAGKVAFKLSMAADGSRRHTVRRIVPSGGA